MLSYHMVDNPLVQNAFQMSNLVGFYMGGLRVGWDGGGWHNSTHSSQMKCLVLYVHSDSFDNIGQLSPGTTRQNICEACGR